MMSTIIGIFILLVIATTCITNCEGARRKYIREDVKPTTSSSTKLITPPNSGFGPVTEQKWRGHGAEFAGIEVHGSEMQNVNAKLAIFAPGKVANGAYSSAFVSVEAGEGRNYNRIEVGWTVNPGYFKDTQIRLFLYSIGNNYQRCVDGRCTDFVIEVSDLKLGDVLTPSDVGHNPQNILDVYIEQNETSSPVWNVEVNSKIIGHFQGQHFNSLVNGATKIQVGGKVYTPEYMDKSPPMGSGGFSNGWKTITSYAQGITIDGDLPHNAQTVETRCYYVGDVGISEFLEGFGFFYGGTGGKDQDECVYQVPYKL